MVHIPIIRGHAWVRCNPDSSYLAQVSGAAIEDLPDIDANESIPFPGALNFTVPDNAGGVPIGNTIIGAGIIELADRVYHGDTSVNLDATLQ